ncbi:MAG: GAF domain-containing protein [Anaerolineae bacterium]|nr:GAF domain-containing protein [Anaerolineae bacterium]
MIKLFRTLFVAQHKYHESDQAIRTRLLLTLSSGTAFLGLLFALSLGVMAVMDVEAESAVSKLSDVLAPVLLVWSLLTLWLARRGHARWAKLSVTFFLVGTSLFSLLTDGIVPRTLLTIPLALAFIGLAYGTWAILVATVFVWGLLPFTAYLQSEDMLSAGPEPFEDLLYETTVSALLLTVLALLLWIFSWNLQRSLVRANRAVTRTRAAAEVGSALSRILNLNELLSRTVDLLRDRFAFFHVQILLVDDKRDYANLVASTGDIGQSLLAQGFRVPLGARTVVGEAVSTNQLTCVGNLVDMGYQRVTLLEDTRSELAVPLIVGENLFGVLNIHSVRPNAFSEEDIEAVRVIATQVSQAIQNARLFESQQRGLLQNRRLFLESETNLREIQRLNRQLTARSWQEYMVTQDVNQSGIHVSGEGMKSGPVEWTPAMHEAALRNRIVTHEAGDDQVIAVPISIRGQPVGAIEVSLSDTHNQSEVRAMLQSVVERMAFSLENVRLFEQARAAAEREQEINTISARLQGLTAVEDVLSTALSTLGEALGADQAAIRLVSLDNAPPGSGAPPTFPGNGSSPDADTDDTSQDRPS